MGAYILVRVARIELASLAWKAGILAIIRHPRMGRMKGIEPSAFGTTTRRSNQLSYIRHVFYCRYNETHCITTGADMTRCLVQFLCLRQGSSGGLRDPRSHD